MIKNQKGNFKRKLAAVALVSATTALTGCLNSGSSGSSTAEGSAQGVAYDGYLVGARVCVDRNLNKACDEGEKFAITQAGGKYQIDNLSDEEQQYPLVMETTASTIDEDTNPPQVVGLGLTFLAPAGSKAISGFSTIIQSKIEQALANGSTKTLAQLKKQAADELAAELGVDVDLTNYDPVAAKNFALSDDASSEMAAKLHLINQVLSDQIKTLKPQAEANGLNSNNTAAFGALIKKLDVAAVKVAVDTDTAALSLPELIAAKKNQIVSAVLPKVPSLQEILDQADLDDRIEDIIDDLIDDDDATGATGATGGSGTA